jgi:hypothetical protein
MSMDATTTGHSDDAVLPQYRVWTWRIIRVDILARIEPLARRAGGRLKDPITWKTK